MNVLIVEDDFYVRKLLKEIMSIYGTCDTVGDGEEAVQAFALSMEENKPYDLICLDIMMPGMNGQEALKQIREFEKRAGIKPAEETKVIMITALSDPKSVFEAYYKGGATHYMTKPIKPVDLIEKVREMGLIK